MESNDASPTAPDRHLPPALQLHILSFLPPNDRALSGRLVSPDAAAGLSKDPTCAAPLSQPLPPHAVPWAAAAADPQHVRQLPFRHKLQLLCSAAASGSEVNMEVALALLQPSVFPDLLHHSMRRSFVYPNPGVAAAETGHPQLLGWLLHHCPGMVDTGRTLMAAAQYCDLAGLQVACEALPQEGTGDRYFECRSEDDLSPTDDQYALDAAAASATADAVDKMEWLLAVGGKACRLQGSEVAEAAARSGDLGRLRWLRNRGCRMDVEWVLRAALQHADLAVSQWLVDEAGCKLPVAAGSGGASYQWREVVGAAVQSPDWVTKLQWLHERGAPPQAGDNGIVKEVVRSAAKAGQAEAVRHLLSGLEPAAARDAAQGASRWAVESGSITTAETVVQAGATIDYWAYTSTAFRTAFMDQRLGGSRVAMVRWLAREARVSAAGLGLPDFIRAWPNYVPADSRDLLQAVQLLVPEAGCRGWDAEATAKAAAERGDLALVQYLLQQRPGFIPGNAVLVGAAKGGNQALLEWLVEQHPGCMEGPGAELQYEWPDLPAGEGSIGAYVSAAARGGLGTLTTLRHLGVPWSAWDTVVAAVKEGCKMPALRWLVKQGAPVGDTERLEAAVDDAVWCGRLCAGDAVWVRSVGAAQ